MVNYHEVRKTLLQDKHCILFGAIAHYRLNLVKISDVKSMIHLGLELVETDNLTLDATIRFNTSNLLGVGSDKYLENMIRKLVRKAMRDFTKDMCKELGFKYVKGKHKVNNNGEK